MDSPTHCNDYMRCGLPLVLVGSCILAAVLTNQPQVSMTAWQQRRGCRRSSWRCVFSSYRQAETKNFRLTKWRSNDPYNTMINWESTYFIPFAVLCCYRNTMVISWAGDVNHWTLAEIVLGYNWSCIRVCWNHEWTGDLKRSICFAFIVNAWPTVTANINWNILKHSSASRFLPTCSVTYFTKLDGCNEYM